MAAGLLVLAEARGRRGRVLLVALATLAGFAAVAASRVAMLDSPYFEEIQYERAPMGLEALAILRGETPVMNWSEPYHGTVFSYLLAPFYALGGDPIRTYGWVSVGLNLLGTLAGYLFARRLWGDTAGIATLVYLALAPAYFPFYDVNSYALFVTLGGLGCFAALQHLVSAPARPRWIWLAGVMLGASVWCHQLGVCFVAAVGATLIAVSGRSFLRADAWRLALGMAIGAAPLIGWNAVFHWIVLRNFTSSDYAARPIEASVEGFWESIGSLLAANTQFWTNPPSAWPWLVRRTTLVRRADAVRDLAVASRGACRARRLRHAARARGDHRDPLFQEPLGSERRLLSLSDPHVLPPADPGRRGGGDARTPLANRCGGAARSDGPARNQRPPPLRRMGKAFARQRRATRSGRARTTRHHPRLCPRPHLAAADARLARAHHRLRLLRHPLRAVPRRRGRRLLGSDRHAQGAQDPFARGRQPLAARP